MLLPENISIFEFSFYFKINNLFILFYDYFLPFYSVNTGNVDGHHRLTIAYLNLIEPRYEPGDITRQSTVTRAQTHRAAQCVLGWRIPSSFPSEFNIFLNLFSY